MFVTVSYYPQGKSRRTESAVIDIPEGSDLMGEARRYVEGLNSELAPFQNQYVLKGVATVRQADPNKHKEVHDWQESSPVLGEDSVGVYSLVKCLRCRCTGRQYKGRHYVTRDPRFLDKTFDNCAAAAAKNIKHRRRER